MDFMQVGYNCGATLANCWSYSILNSHDGGVSALSLPWAYLDIKL